jgi:hypothetical protein
MEVSRIIRNCANDKIDSAFHRLGFETVTFDAAGDEGEGNVIDHQTSCCCLLYIA